MEAIRDYKVYVDGYPIQASWHADRSRSRSPGLANALKFLQEKRERERQERSRSRKARQAAAKAKQKPLKAAEAEDRRKIGEISYADVEARVRPVKDLDVLVRVPGKIIPNADLILSIAQEEVSNWSRRVERKPEGVEAPGSATMLAELEKLMREDEDNKPIILVPCNKNAPVNLLTVQKLLQDGQYDVIDGDTNKWFESTRSETVEIVRNIQGRRWSFEARDSTKGFTKNHWLRVVAVISDGSDWQFKGWPFENIVDMFATIRGFFFCPRGELPAQHVKDWAVHILKMPQMQHQHQFAQIKDVFWSEVEAFLRSNRQKKFVNHATLDTSRQVKKTLAVF